MKLPHSRIAPRYWATTTEQHERGSASRLDGSYFPGQNLPHTNEVRTDSGLASDPSRGHISVEPGRVMLCQTKLVAASESLSSTCMISSSHLGKEGKILLIQVFVLLNPALV